VSFIIKGLRAESEKALEELAAWLPEVRERIRGQIVIREAKTATGTMTAVSIDHRLTCDLPTHAGWHVQTKQAFLSQEHFGSEMRIRVNNAAKARGRAIYCHDPQLAEVTSVVSYHVDERRHLPVLITTLGFRKDVEGNPALGTRTLAAALVLKHHVHAIAERIGRGGYVDLDLADKRDLEWARRLGFRKAPRLKGFRPAGEHLRQQAPS